MSLIYFNKENNFPSKSDINREKNSATLHIKLYFIFIVK